MKGKSDANFLMKEKKMMLGKFKHHGMYCQVAKNKTANESEQQKDKLLSFVLNDLQDTHLKIVGNI